MAEREEKNVVLFPFMAQGHIIPMLALAFHLEQTTNYSISIINTPLNVKKLKSSLPPNSSIHLLELLFNSSDHGLPPDSENTDVLPYHLVLRLFQASTSLRPFFKHLIHKMIEPNRPLCIIADVFFGWSASVAKELGVFHVLFSGCSGYGLACYCSLWLNLPQRKENSDVFFLPDFPEAGKIQKTQVAPYIYEADGCDPWSIIQRENFSHWVNSYGVLFNTVEELDQSGLQYFRRKLGLPVWAIGPVILSTGSRDRAGKEGGISSGKCQKWLDTKPLNSVLYVSFGSMNTISALQMEELAMALEESGKNFIWVVRPPLEFDINSEFKAEEWLPKGFEERMQESRKGLIVHNWVPQLEIISHKAVSAFLSHCGWNSVLEALSQGLPIIGWPLSSEQFFNSKLLGEEFGVCVEVARGKICEVKHEELAAKIDLVMSETDRGKEIRRKACEMGIMIKNAMRNEDGFRGSSAKAMDDFFTAGLSPKHSC